MDKENEGAGVTYQAWVRGVSRVDAQVREGGALTTEQTSLEQEFSITGF